MKKTGKALIGVLSVAALVGTGVATWTINGGIVSETTGPITPTIAEIGTRDIAIEVTAKDSTLVFDAVDDLKVIYNVKAKAGTGAAAGFEPYGYDFKNIVPEYQPNLSITTQVLRNGSPIDENDPFFDFVEVPNDESETNISYLDWLNEDLKDKGYDATLTFAWGAETGGLNPQKYVDSNSSIYNTPELQRGFFERVNAALDKITFTFTFKVGGLKDTPVETPDTGEITIPTVTGSTLTIDGMTGTTVEAGTHRITITTEEGKEVTDKKLTVIENGTTKNDFTLTEETLTGASGHTYYVDYEFKADTTYSFEYTLKDEEVLPTLYTVTYTQPENGKITLMNGEKEVTTGTKVDENTTLDLTVTANEGYHITSVLVNGGEAGTGYTTKFTKQITATGDLTISAIMEIDEEPVKEYAKLGDLMQIGYKGGEFTDVNVKGEIVAINTSGFVLHDGTGYIQFYKYGGYSDEYKVGTIIEATGTPETYTNKSGTNYPERLQFDSLDESSITILSDDAFKADLGDITNLNTAVNEEGFNTESLRGKYIEAEVQPFASGSYTNFNIVGYEGETYTIAFNDSTFDDDVDLTKTYKVEALYSYTSSNRITLFVLDMEEIIPTYDPVESVKFTNVETELEVGKTLKLTSEVLPATANQEVTYSITSGSDYATLEGDVLTGVAEGEITVTVTTIGLSNEEIQVTNTKTIAIKDSEPSSEYTYLKLESTSYVGTQSYDKNITAFNDGTYGSSNISYGQVNNGGTPSKKLVWVGASSKKALEENNLSNISDYSSIGGISYTSGSDFAALLDLNYNIGTIKNVKFNFYSLRDDVEIYLLAKTPEEQNYQLYETLTNLEDDGTDDGLIEHAFSIPGEYDIQLLVIGRMGKNVRVGIDTIELNY